MLDAEGEGKDDDVAGAGASSGSNRGDVGAEERGDPWLLPAFISPLPATISGIGDVGGEKRLLSWLERIDLL